VRYNLIVPCGGSGVRTGLPYNKLFYKGKDNKMMIEKTLSKFLEDERCTRIILAINDDQNYFNFVKEYDKVYFVQGGLTREESVKSGLGMIEIDCDYVLVHDGDRPFINKEVVKNVLNALEEGYLSVIPCVASVDATIYKEDYTDGPIYFVQTPQGFKKEVLIKAFDCDVSIFRDEGSMVKKVCGIVPHIVEGSYENIKITNKEDLKLLEGE
jgi:2-C-methyl-D-erythritol 4-phosphate cytidylyltransferase